MKKLLLAFILVTASAFLLWKVSRPSLDVIEETKVSVDAKNTTGKEAESLVDNQKSISVPHREASDFPDRLDHYFKALPTMDDLKNLTEEEVHHTPEIIKNGGELIGRIHDEAENDPAKRSDAMNFFKRCAEDHQIAVVMRAVCLNKVYKLIPVWKIPVPLSEANISDEVSDLALKLP